MKCKSLIALVLTLACSLVLAAEPRWNDSPYELYANGESLTNVLKNFAASYGIPVTVSPRIAGAVNGNFKGDTPRQFLEILGKSFEFEWYYDGSTMHFFRGDEIVSRIITLTNIKTSQLRNAVEKVGIWDDRFSWKEMPDKGLVYVSGPTSMVELIQETASVLESQVVTLPRRDQYSMQMFRLRYATAADRVQSYRGKEVVVPGLASVLRGALAAGQGKRGDTTLGGPVGILEGKQRTTSVTSEMPGTGEKAWVEADSRTNSIIIYDRLERMPMYKALVRNLDQPSEQVEVNVSIITVSATNLEELGVSWQARDQKYGEIGYGGVNDQTPAPGKNQVAILGGADASFSTVLDSGLDYFLAKVDALVQDGNAQVVSRPSVVTNEHLEAVLDDSTTFHVRVQGNEQVDLFPVTVGSVLRVTPHIQGGNEREAINLEVTIEDGQQTDKEVDNIPVIKTSSINTQTVVGLGQSLLIGGFFQDYESDTVGGIPVLKDIPLLGVLFRTQSHDRKKMVKLFLLTPKIITDIPIGGQAANGREVYGYSFQIGSKDKDRAQEILEYFDSRGFVTSMEEVSSEGQPFYYISIGNYSRCEDTQRVANAFPAPLKGDVSMINSCHPLTR
ncbi:EscC/YscC/HrcC family type III secretion system outer membrane ring protein [Hahella sp. CCB-MM4]|uniref:type III secretion system outer membrane ring subunit SctC n=1 Tax=Hahella sp. (strain CCB-MM4) TaxID=1926491 RepID=UPI000B9B7802|nr:type III secretion system outer membrane ring subunit SctC [Hahella sp. CCB-MM4]OZG72641.1 EscC/YscC/HrcC family type III secretion system outer membrane ring protein [Hahella sp. CCB-MM4]